MLADIKAGWGITFETDQFNKFRAIIPCPANTYGVANKTYGLINAPCKACTKNLYSPANSTSFQACKNPVGFGYTSEGANQCPDGFWAAKDSMLPCEQCPPGRTTQYIIGNGSAQASVNDCIVKDGNGVYDPEAEDPWNPTNTSSNTTAAPCPVGTYFEGEVLGSQTTNPKCKQCAAGQSTASTGSSSCNGEYCLPLTQFDACSTSQQLYGLCRALLCRHARGWLSLPHPAGLQAS